MPTIQRGIANLVVTATKGVTAVVEEMHRTIAGGPATSGRPLSRPVNALVPLFYGPVHRVTSLVGTGIDLVLSQLGTLLGESIPGADRDAVVSALNGVLGDYLEQTKNPLAIRMGLRTTKAPVTPDDVLAEQLADATGKVVVLLHGSAMSDRQWNRAGHDHGAALAGSRLLTPRSTCATTVVCISRPTDAHFQSGSRPWSPHGPAHPASSHFSDSVWVASSDEAPTMRPR